MSSTTLQTYDLETPNSRSHMECQIPHVTDFKSAYVSLIIAHRGLACETNLLQGQTRIANLKSSYHSLIIGPRGLQCETNFRKA